LVASDEFEKGELELPPDRLTLDKRVYPQRCGFCG